MSNDLLDFSILKFFISILDWRNILFISECFGVFQFLGVKVNMEGVTSGCSGNVACVGFFKDNMEEYVS